MNKDAVYRLCDAEMIKDWPVHVICDTRDFLCFSVIMYICVKSRSLSFMKVLNVCILLSYEVKL